MNPPLLYVLDVSRVNLGEWIRVGDGSNSEYRQVNAIGTIASNTHVPLNFPLAFSHPAGGANNVEQFARTADPAYTAPFALTQDAAAGDEIVIVSGAAADIATLAGASHPLLELGPPGRRELRFVDSVTTLSTTTARVQLQGGGLVLSFATTNPATVLSISGAPVRQANLTPAANAGDRLIYVDNRNGDFDSVNDIVVVDRLDATLHEARMIGALSTLELSSSAARHRRGLAGRGHPLQRRRAHHRCGRERR